jgi:uncharacterized DUF497 family protein
MERKVEFVSSAFKHDVSEENIRWVLNYHLADGLIEEDDEDKYIAIGFDKSGKLLEVFYDYIDEETVKVFHAMKCRKEIRDKMGI